jgi:hypothetical protein
MSRYIYNLSCGLLIGKLDCRNSGFIRTAACSVEVARYQLGASTDLVHSHHGLLSRRHGWKVSRQPFLFITSFSPNIQVCVGGFGSHHNMVDFLGIRYV